MAKNAEYERPMTPEELQRASDWAQHMLASLFQIPEKNPMVVLAALASASGVIAGNAAGSTGQLEQMLVDFRENLEPNARANFRLVNNLPMGTPEEMGFHPGAKLGVHHTDELYGGAPPTGRKH